MVERKKHRTIHFMERCEFYSFRKEFCGCSGVDGDDGGGAGGGDNSSNSVLIFTSKNPCALNVATSFEFRIVLNVCVRGWYVQAHKTYSTLHLAKQHSTITTEYYDTNVCVHLKTKCTLRTFAHAHAHAYEHAHITAQSKSFATAFMFKFFSMK